MNNDDLPPIPPPSSPIRSALAFFVALSAAVVVGFFAINLLSSFGRPGPRDMGQLAVTFARFGAIVVGTATALIGALASSLGLKLDDRPSLRPWFKVLLLYHLLYALVVLLAFGSPLRT